jgi:hypothetical protein
VEAEVDTFEMLVLVNAGMLVLIAVAVVGALALAVWKELPRHRSARPLRPEVGSDLDLKKRLEERETAALANLARGLKEQGGRTGVTKSDEEWHQHARELLAKTWGG